MQRCPTFFAQTSSYFFRICQRDFISIQRHQWQLLQHFLAHLAYHPVFSDRKKLSADAVDTSCNKEKLPINEETPYTASIFSKSYETISLKYFVYWTFSFTREVLRFEAVQEYTAVPHRKNFYERTYRKFISLVSSIEHVEPIKFDVYQLHSRWFCHVTGFT